MGGDVGSDPDLNAKLPIPRPFKLYSGEGQIVATSASTRT